MEPEEVNAVSKEEKSASSRQNEKLYAEEGMLNAKLQKAEKKRRKKENRPPAMGDEMNEDYDFKVDYLKKRDSEMDTANNDSGIFEENNKNRFELPSGVDLDNEWQTNSGQAALWCCFCN